eukprot:scaffold32044_cov30-Tisochrysis_lutea.AAC.8
MDRAHDGNLRLHGNLLHELHYFGRRRRVEARGWLVQKDDGWSLGERASKRETPLLAARQAAEEHVARLGVLTTCEAGCRKQIVDRRLAFGVRERRAIQINRVAKVITASEERPQQILLRDDGAVLGVQLCASPRPGSRVSILSSVVFPAPDGPMTASTCPAETDPDTLHSNCFCLVLVQRAMSGSTGLPFALIAKE